MASPPPIDIFTREPAETDRREFPLTVGLPFARGALAPDTPVAVRDETGNALPLQDTNAEGRYATMPAQGFANLESLAYAYRLTGDTRYVEAGVALPEPPRSRRAKDTIR